MKSLVAVVSFAAVVFLVGSACGRDPTGTPVRDSTATGKIAFIGNDDDGTGLYIVNADGTGLTRLHNAHSAAWGSRKAYTCAEGLAEGQPPNLDKLDNKWHSSGHRRFAQRTLMRGRSS